MQVVRVQQALEALPAVVKIRLKLKLRIQEWTARVFHG
jgi:hypothetical protein